MTPKARAAFEIYRDLGPTRTLKRAAELIGKGVYMLNQWSAQYQWVRLCEEHDHAELREALGKREIVKERTLQTIIDRSSEAADVLYEIMTDRRVLPVLDRHGEHMLDGDGNKMYKPVVKPSTRAMCAEKILGIGGLVPVKRTETIDRTAESLDAAAAVLQSMSPTQLKQLHEILSGDDS
jgi:hypothetical protein